MIGEIGSLLHRGARSLHITNKRRGVVQRESGGIQWDSVSSVSSISELSEGPTTTGTDEMSERETVASVSPVPASYDTSVFSVDSVESSTPEVLLNGSTPPNSLDSGVIADPLSGSWAGSLGEWEKEGGRKAIGISHYRITKRFPNKIKYATLRDSRST